MTLGGVEDQWVDTGTKVPRHREVGVRSRSSDATTRSYQGEREEEEERSCSVPLSCIYHDFGSSVAEVVSAVPAEASTLPVSDKPVTLSFKGGSKPTNPTESVLQPIQFSNCFAGTPASSVAAASTLGFSMTEEGDPDVVEGDRAASNEDPKGLSHPRYEGRSFWTCILMVRAQLPRPRKWLP
jgi:hypothetical protein